MPYGGPCPPDGVLSGHGFTLQDRNVLAFTAHREPADVLLDRPLAKVASAVKIAIKGDDPDAEKAKVARVKKDDADRAQAHLDVAFAIFTKTTDADERERMTIMARYLVKRMEG